ncbi:MAG: hypothetical protein ACQEXJ_15755 [Myxococcota bacterium]
MGKMIDGVWTTQRYHPDDEGRFQREETVFHGRNPDAQHGRG